MYGRRACGGWRVHGCHAAVRARNYVRLAIVWTCGGRACGELGCGWLVIYVGALVIQFACWWLSVWWVGIHRVPVGGRWAYVVLALYVWTCGCWSAVCVGCELRCARRITCTLLVSAQVGGVHVAPQSRSHLLAHFTTRLRVQGSVASVPQSRICLTQLSCRFPVGLLAHTSGARSVSFVIPSSSEAATTPVVSPPTALR